MAHLNSLTAVLTRTSTTSAPTRLRSTALARSATMVAGALIAMTCARVACAESNVVAWGANDYGQCNVPQTLGAVMQISGGDGHSVAVKFDGTVVHWGGGYASPPAGLGVVTAIDAGGNHTLALRADGSVVAWGVNTSGQCNVPQGLGVCTAIAAGELHSTAIKANGYAAAWGLNNYGQSYVSPNLGVVTQIAPGYGHTVVVEADGSVAAWGYNFYGQCNVPPGLGVVTDISSGSYHTVALKADGSVVAWGWNNYGQSTVPPGLGVVTDIAAGNYYTVALKVNGSVAAWGGGTVGEIPAGLGGVTQIAAGGRHVLALRPTPADDCFNAATAVLGMNSIDTSLLTPSADPPQPEACISLGWGNSKDAWFVYNAPGTGLLSAEFCASSYDTSVVVYQGSCGALVRVGCAADGCGYQNSRSSIVDLPVESGLVYIRIGGYGAADGLATFELSFERSSPACWGNNSSGQCNTPLGLGILTDIAAGNGHTVAMQTNGFVVAWGDNGYGQCTVPQNIGAVTHIAAGYAHTVALKATGAVAAWGWNAFGQCTVPPGLGVVIQIAAGDVHTVAVKATGAVAAWGLNDAGACTVPPNLGVVTHVAAGGAHTVALKADGSIAAWGLNNAGQSNVPAGLGVVTQIAAGGNCTLALKANGSVAAWGSAGYGQTNVPPGLGVVTHIAASVYHVVVAKADGSVAAWGASSSGQCTIPAGLGPVTRVAAGGAHTVAMWPALADECFTAATAVLGMNSIDTSLLMPSVNPPEDGACVELDWGNSKDAWFVYNAPSSGLLSADFCSSLYDTSVVIYQGSCGALVRVGCDDDSCGQSYRSRIIDLPVQSGPVYIRIGGYQNAAGIATFNLSFEDFPEPADECDNPATAVLGWNSIDTSLLTPSVNPPENGACDFLDWLNSKDAWFVYNAPSSGLLSADFCSSLYDTSVVLYQGSCGALVRVGCDDDSCGKSFRSRIIDLPVESGPVYIRIGGYSGAVGLVNFDLSFELNCTTDLDGNGSTGAPDLALLLSMWGNAGAADFDNSGIVGASDLSLMLAEWGACP